MSTIETPADGLQTAETSDRAEAEPTLTADQIFRLLQHERRRTVLRELRDEDGTVHVRDLAERVVAREHDATVGVPPSDERQRVSVSLDHSHLPKLDDVGVIAYDRSQGVVERTPLADRLDRYLDPVKPNDATADPARSWDSYYLGASGVCTLLFAGTAFDVASLATLSGVALSAVILILFTALTATRIATT